MKFTKSYELVIDIDPLELGKVFANMFDEEQVEFFKGIAKAIQYWPKDASVQWQSLRDKLENEPDALKAFKGLSEYGVD